MAGLMVIGKRMSAIHRSAFTRSVRPSITSNQISQSRPRLFTQNHPLLLLTRTSSPRPQLPYLSQPSRPQALPRGPAFQRQIARLLTTENGSYVKSQMWMAIKWTAVGWSMLFMLAMAWYGWQQELVERDHPSPDEWSYFTRTAFRHAHSKLDPEFDGSGVIDWAAVGSEFRRCLERLEKLNGDGKGLVPVVEQDGESHTIMGVDTTAYDISSKSYPWRAGYFQVIMGCARAAEFLDDMVRDKTRKMVFPKEVVIGPSNPDARPVPPGAAAAPLEENCDRPYAPPDTFYLKVLTGAGFSTKQKVEAALAYANWLEFKGLHDTAEETYRWAIDIAAAAVPGGDSIIDKASGIISIGPKVSNTLFSTPSPNLLHAATALATHHARTGNVTSALPIYLSVLRARHAAPVDTEVIPQATREAFDAHAGTDYARAWALFRSIIRSAEYPKEPASGDDAFLRSSDTDRDCAEAELMLYIGEILFATSSPSSGEGLNWTKKAVSIAEPGVTNKDLTPDERNVCKSCLETGVANWSTMVNTLLKEEREKNANTILPAKGWSSWFGGSKDEKNTGGTRWEDEAKEVDELRLRLVNQGISDRMASSRAVPNSVWVG